MGWEKGGGYKGGIAVGEVDWKGKNDQKEIQYEKCNRFVKLGCRREWIMKESLNIKYTRSESATSLQHVVMVGGGGDFSK